MSKQGTLYGIGVGPGDPELLTLKGWRLLNAVNVIAYPQTSGGKRLARDIVAPFIPDEATELAIDVPMTSEREPARDAYDKAATEIAGHLSAGRHVAFLCEGDPFFYGSFMYLFSRLASDHKVEIVPGVSSLMASAAAARQPLAARNDTLTALPAGLPKKTLAARIKAADAVVFMKVARHLPKIRDVLDELELTEKATLVSAATTDRQKVTPLADVTGDETGYFSTVVLYKGGEDW